MMQRLTFLFLIQFSLLFSTVALADDITERMTSRRPTIEALKKEGLLGENNKGYLEFVTTTQKQKDVVDAQNEDRKKGYEIVSKKQGVSIEQVAKIRSAYYAKKAKSGEFIQNSSGKWIRK